MSWQALKIHAEQAHADALADALLELGALSAAIEDADAGTGAEEPIFGEPTEAPPGLWRHSLVSALLDAEADVAGVVAQAAARTGADLTGRWEVATLEETDWVRQTQSQFDPIRISARLWIVPTWHEAPDPAAVNIALDPGLAFGTGSHPTTRLCLAWLDENLAGGERVLDYGCGSGILAIAAAKLGAAEVVGVDIDPQAVQAARDNAQRNRVTAGFFLPGAAPRFQADVVVANILTNPLKLLAPALAAACRPGGRIVLSGILSPQADDVMAVYGQWFTLDARHDEDGWACLGGTRRAP
jgi:ribosomal protein L11 methyltransferase